MKLFKSYSQWLEFSEGGDPKRTLLIAIIILILLIALSYGCCVDRDVESKFYHSEVLRYEVAWRYPDNYFFWMVIAIEGKEERVQVRDTCYPRGTKLLYLSRR